MLPKILSIFERLLQEIGYQHAKMLFTGWARGDIIKNMLRDHRSADYNDSKRTDVSPAVTHTHTHIKNTIGFL